MFLSCAASQLCSGDHYCRRRCGLCHGVHDQSRVDCAAANDNSETQSGDVSAADDDSDGVRRAVSLPHLWQVSDAVVVTSCELSRHFRRSFHPHVCDDVRSHVIFDDVRSHVIVPLMSVMTSVHASPVPCPCSPVVKPLGRHVQ